MRKIAKTDCLKANYFDGNDVDKQKVDKYQRIRKCIKKWKK